MQGDRGGRTGPARARVTQEEYDVRKLPLPFGFVAAALWLAPTLAVQATPPPNDEHTVSMCDGKYSAQIKHAFNETAHTAGMRSQVNIVRNPLAAGSVPNPTYYESEVRIASRLDTHPKWITDRRSRDEYGAYPSSPLQLDAQVPKNAGCKLLGTVLVSVQCPGGSAIESKEFKRSWDGCDQ